MYSAPRNPMIGRNKAVGHAKETIVGFRGLLSYPMVDTEGNQDHILIGLASGRDMKLWQPGEDKTAKCDLKTFMPWWAKWTVRGHRDKAPLGNCTCGLYGYYGMGAKNEFYGDVAVMVQSWGRHVYQETGYRAEHMRIAAIIKRPGDPNYIPHQQIAQTYGVRVIDAAHAEQQATEYGHLVTEEEQKAWNEEFKRYYKKSVVKAALAGLFALVVWMATLFSNVLMDPEKMLHIPYVVWFCLTLVVYWVTPTHFFRGIRTVLQYRDWKEEESFVKK